MGDDQPSIAQILKFRELLKALDSGTATAEQQKNAASALRRMLELDGS